ncbi:MAG: hypothetical protein QM811_04835 [Pirellulales bacterium]
MLDRRSIRPPVPDHDLPAPAPAAGLFSRRAWLVVAGLCLLPWLLNLWEHYIAPVDDKSFFRNVPGWFCFTVNLMWWGFVAGLTWSKPRELGRALVALLVTSLSAIGSFVYCTGRFDFEEWFKLYFAVLGIAGGGAFLLNVLLRFPSMLINLEGRTLSIADHANRPQWSLKWLLSLTSAVAIAVFGGKYVVAYGDVRFGVVAFIYFAYVYLLWTLSLRPRFFTIGFVVIELIGIGGCGWLGVENWDSPNGLRILLESLSLLLIPHAFAFGFGWADWWIVRRDRPDVADLRA